MILLKDFVEVLFSAKIAFCGECNFACCEKILCRDTIYNKVCRKTNLIGDEK